MCHANLGVFFINMNQGSSSSPNLQHRPGELEPSVLGVISSRPHIPSSTILQHGTKDCTCNINICVISWSSKNLFNVRLKSRRVAIRPWCIQCRHSWEPESLHQTTYVPSFDKTSHGFRVAGETGHRRHRFLNRRKLQWPWPCRVESTYRLLRKMLEKTPDDTIDRSLNNTYPSYIHYRSNFWTISHPNIPDISKHHGENTNRWPFQFFSSMLTPAGVPSHHWLAWRSVYGRAYGSKLRTPRNLWMMNIDIIPSGNLT